jgi:hypothetical protein
LSRRVNADLAFALPLTDAVATRVDVALTMPDAFVYYFLIRDRSSGRLVTSKRRATLEAIKCKGEPLWESRTAVDDSELDATGFLVSRADNGSDPADELWGDIRSLRLRADWRDQRAKQLSEKTHREQKLILCAESQELRNRADRLQQLIHAKNVRTSGQPIQSAARAAAAEKSELFKPE